MTSTTTDAESESASDPPFWAAAAPGGALFDILDGLKPGMPDGELLAGIRAARRLTAACHGLEAGLHNELYERRVAQDIEDGAPSDKVGRYAADELSVEIGITVRTAIRQLDRAAGLAGLPRTLGALRAGRISEWHANVIADWAGNCELPEDVAEVIESAMLAAVGTMHTGKLRRLGEQLWKDLAPGLYEERRKHAIGDRHVEVKDEQDGTATLKASQVNKAIAHRVYDQLRADAKELQRLGDDRNLGAIMADLLLRRALGEIDNPIGKHDPGPESEGPKDGGGSGGRDDGGDAPTGAGGGDGPAEDAGVLWPEAPMPDDPQPDDGTEADGEAMGWLRMAQLTRRRVKKGDADPFPDILPGDEGRCGRDEACERCGPAATDLEDLRGQEVRLEHHIGARMGPLRREAARLLRAGACVKIVTKGGKTIQHGSGHYVPSPGMRRIVQQRHGYCAFPGCLRRAHKCEVDHSEPWPEGPSCNCNLATLCKRHHLMKHTPRWGLEQPEPGLIVWTTPGGRRVRVDRRPP